MNDDFDEKYFCGNMNELLHDNVIQLENVFCVLLCSIGLLFEISTLNFCINPFVRFFEIVNKLKFQFRLTKILHQIMIGLPITMKLINRFK